MAPPAAIDVLPESDTTTFTQPDRLTIQGVAKRRAAEGRLVAGVAAIADVERFKGRSVHAHKPKAKRWDREYFFFFSYCICSFGPFILYIDSLIDRSHIDGQNHFVHYSLSRFDLLIDFETSQTASVLSPTQEDRAH